MVQKGREEDLGPGKSIPRYRVPTSTAVLVSGHGGDLAGSEEVNLV